MLKHLPLLVLCAVGYCEYYDTFTGQRISQERFQNLERVGLVPICARRVPPCSDSEPRRTDGTCTNPAYPQRGSAYTPFRRLLEPAFSPDGDLRVSQTGEPLPLVRPLRVDLMSDGRAASRRHTHLVAMFFLILVADTTSVHDTVNYVAVTTTCCQPGGREDPRCIPIEVLPDDLHLRPTNVRCLNLTRSVTYQRVGCVPPHIPPERVNQATPMLDLSSVYGNDASVAARMRSYQGGRLRADIIQGKEWPPSGGSVCLNNQPPLETRCHADPAAANALLGINILFMWLYRHHNALSRALERLNPCWGDERLHRAARDLNLAMLLQVAYYELMPEFLGYDFLVQNKVIYPTAGHVDDFDPALEPRISIEFVTAMRWFHTIQEGRHKLYTSSGTVYGSVSSVDMILRTGALAHNRTLAGLTRGTFRQAGGDVDGVVDPDLGERVLGRLQFVSDVISSDIMKGRDLGLAPYSQYRRLCGLSVAKTFDDLRLWMDDEKVDALARHYAVPDDIDLMAGILSERASVGLVGPTLACIMTEQLQRWRRADKYWYERPGHFTLAQLHEIRKMSAAMLVCSHGDGVRAVQPRAFRLPAPGNEITDCSKYEMPDLSVFRDSKCYPSPDIYPTHPETYPSHPETYPSHPETYPSHPDTYPQYPHQNIKTTQNQFSYIPTSFDEPQIDLLYQNQQKSRKDNELPKNYVYSYESVVKCESCSVADPFHKFLSYQ